MTKISAFSDGTPIQSGDVVPVVRSGANYKAQLGTAAGKDTGTASGNAALFGTGGAFLTNRYLITATEDGSNVKTITLPGADTIVHALIASSLDIHGIFLARVGRTPYAAGSSSFAGTSGVLTGTTGVSGKITVSTSGNTLYIENRTGSAVYVTLSLFHAGI